MMDGDVMKVVICYDVKDNRIRYKLVKYLEKIANRIQYSVFVAELNQREISQLITYGENLLKERSVSSFAVFQINGSLSNYNFQNLSNGFVIV